MARQVLTLSYLPDGLNKLMRKNARYTASDRDPCRDRLFAENAPMLVHSAEVRVNVSIFISSVMSDWENSAVRFKHIGDGLKELGVIKDDKPSVLVSFEVGQVKAWHKKDEKVLVEVEDLIRDRAIKRFKRPRERSYCELIQWHGSDTGKKLYTIYQQRGKGDEHLIVTAVPSPDDAIKKLLESDPTFQEIPNEDLLSMRVG